MEKTPKGLRKTVTLFGDVNSGKSTLFNALLKQEAAIVSSLAGTTTDPISKGMELINYGPITLIDTAGFDDESPIGKKRIDKTLDIIKRTDLALLVINISSFDLEKFKDTIKKFKEKKIEYIIVFTNLDRVSKEEGRLYKNKYKDSLHIDYSNKESLDLLYNKISEKLKLKDEGEESLIGGLLKKGSFIALVIKLDEAAPKGRLILPQVQLIRECLDYEIGCIVVKDTQLKKTLDEIKNIDLVVTDSQIFNEVSKLVPKDIPLSSFSMLLARQKGDIYQFIEGVKKLKSLKDGDKILVAEACTHNTSHEDIGRVKIPNLIKKHIGKELIYDYYVGYDFPENLDTYKIVIHCGACMINKKTILNRLELCRELNIPITNYGVLLAYLNGILSRSCEIFSLEKEGIYD